MSDLDYKINIISDEEIEELFNIGRDRNVVWKEESREIYHTHIDLYNYYNNIMSNCSRSISMEDYGIEYVTDLYYSLMKDINPLNKRPEKSKGAPQMDWTIDWKPFYDIAKEENLDIKKFSDIYMPKTPVIGGAEIMVYGNAEILKSRPEKKMNSFPLKRRKAFTDKLPPKYKHIACKENIKYLDKIYIY